MMTVMNGMMFIQEKIMKGRIAWLVWEYEDSTTPSIEYEDFPDWYYFKKVKIVYFEVE